MNFLKTWSQQTLLKLLITIPLPSFFSYLRQQNTFVFINKMTFRISSEILHVHCLKYHNTGFYFSVTLNYHLCIHMHWIKYRYPLKIPCQWHMFFSNFFYTNQQCLVLFSKLPSLFLSLSRQMCQNSSPSLAPLFVR